MTHDGWTSDHAGGASGDLMTDDLHTPDEVAPVAAAHEEGRRLRASADRFVRWLDLHGYESFDPYDIWGTPYGLMARRLYYQRSPLGYVLTAPGLALEILCPRLRQWWVPKMRYPTADAQLGLAFLNLHRVSADGAYVNRAAALGADLLRSASPGYQGLGWGYPFDWQNNKGLWRRNTPYITATPYCYELFAGLAERTGEPGFREAAASAARFVATELRDTPTGDNSTAGSYSPHDETRVINASAYRAFVLFDAAERCGRREYATSARRNLNFILEQQRPDGSWLYGLDGPMEAFVDHFHTCFVLKNLFKLNRLLHEPAVSEAIGRGWTYYRRNLFGPDGLPKGFAVQPRLQLVRVEAYNFAEAITLGTLLGDDIPEALLLARRLAQRLITEFQLRSGHFVTRVYVGGIRHTLPFLRWPQAQLLLALTGLLVRLSALDPSAPANARCGHGTGGESK